MWFAELTDILRTMKDAAAGANANSAKIEAIRAPEPRYLQLGALRSGTALLTLSPQPCSMISPQPFKSIHETYRSQSSNQFAALHHAR